MKQKLESTGLYTVSEGSAVHCELAAYAREIDRIYAMLDELLRECFISTARDYGISLREEFTGRQNSSMSLERRRELLIAQESDAGFDCTYDGYLEFLRSLGLSDFTITPKPVSNRIDIAIRDEVSEPQKKLIQEKVFANGPAGDAFVITYEN